jgi:hypothetical protein
MLRSSAEAETRTRSEESIQAIREPKVGDVLQEHFATLLADPADGKTGIIRVGDVSLIRRSGRSIGMRRP